MIIRLCILTIFVEYTNCIVGVGKNVWRVYFCFGLSETSPIKLSNDIYSSIRKNYILIMLMIDITRLII